jgi:uncharacterized circularly permuted ATP-grasp superfamily protein/uncharacterized alpha-E superfamily protein
MRVSDALQQYEDGMNLDSIERADGSASDWQYKANSAFYDELVAADGKVRPHWNPLVDSLSRIGHGGLLSRWQEGRRLLHDNGVTYNVYGDPAATDRPWPLDPVPLVIAAREWEGIETALRQRATLLNAVLADLYGPRRLLREDLLPPELVFRHEGFLRPCTGVSVPNDIYLHTYAADIARAPDGRWWVLADRTQAPSGAGYALENRLVSTRVLGDVFRTANVRRLASFFQVYRETLRSLVPRHRENPRIVLLTPGPYNETYFEHAFLARYLGFTLVEGGDLTVRENSVFLKTLGGLLPVDLIIRRQDDSFCDPVELRGDSMLGVAGLLEAVRLGNVAVTNALGSGLIESAAPTAFLPNLCRNILGEDLKMPTVATWWCGQPEALAYVTEHLSTLVIKPTFPDHRHEPIFGARLTAKQRERLLTEMRAFPDDYVAQEQVALATVPVWDERQLQPRHFVLRVYLVANGDSYAVMPGGLTRVTTSLDSLVVSMQHGGGSKDTWVLADQPAAEFSLLRPESTPIEVNRATIDLPSRIADNLFWLGRYVERVEMVVRVTRAILSRISQESDPLRAAGIEAGYRVLAVLGHLGAESKSALKGDKSDAPEKPVLSPERQLLEMIYDSKSPGGLGWNLHQVRRVAWLLRDRISADAWQILNHFEQEFSAPTSPEPLRISAAANLLDHFIITLSAFSGLVMESMTRGHGWRFLDIGRRLERAIQMVDLVRCGLGYQLATDSGQLEVLLEIADSSLTYRSRYLTSMQENLVIDLLLLDEANPRSAAFQLARLREHIDQLPESVSLTHRPPEWRLAVRLLTAVQVAEAAELVRPDEHGHLVNLETLVSRLAAELPLLSETLTRSYFDHAVAAPQLYAS